MPRNKKRNNKLFLIAIAILILAYIVVRFVSEEIIAPQILIKIFSKSEDVSRKNFCRNECLRDIKCEKLCNETLHTDGNGKLIYEYTSEE